MSDVLRELAERLERDSIEAMDVGRPHLADRLTDDMETLRLAADVLDAIPDKDDPVGWVQDIEQTILEMRVAQRMANETLKTWVDAIPGDDKLAVAEWAVKIAARLMDEWEEGSTHDDTYYVVERWWRLCPPSVRAALRSVGGES